MFKNITVFNLMFVLILGLNISNGNVKYDFNKDRKMEKKGNVVYVEPEAEYQNEKIDAIENDVQSLKKEMSTLREEMKSLEKDLKQTKERFNSLEMHQM